MLNEGAVVDDAALSVLSGVKLSGKINLPEETILDHIRHSVRLGYPQIRPDPPKAERIVLVGGGPSLADPEIFKELRDLLWQDRSTMLVTVNGSYHWCIERNLKPNCQIVMDARPHNARFLDPHVPGCRYVLASQCHPDTWARVEDRPNVWIFHAAAGGDDNIRAFLDHYYMKQWWGCSGGTTVATRAIALLRTLGYLRFDLFGVDSCWMNGNHHTYVQAENDNEVRYRAVVHPEGREDLARSFTVSPWHAKQAEDFIQVIRVNGSHFLLNVHGDGMIAYLLRTGPEAVITEMPATPVSLDQP